MDKPRFKFSDFVYWLFLALLAFQAGRLITSVDELNKQMASVMSILGQHEKRLDKGGL